MGADNPPAFPSVCLNDLSHTASAPGMSLRDWFAGQVLSAAMQAMQSSLIGSHPEAGGGPSGFAATAYDIADAMLAERAKEQPNAR